MYARPPASRTPHLTPVNVAGVGEGYNRQVDQDFWCDDGTDDFAELWRQTADSAVFR